MKIHIISDTHYGLNSAGFDRTEEIHSIMWRFLTATIKSKANMVIHCGDLGQTNHPTSEIYALWIRLCEELEIAGIQTRFLIGNHDIIHRRGTINGSLQPLAEIGYQNIQIISDFRIEHLIGKWHAIYLPYMSQSAYGSNLQKIIEQNLKKVLDNLQDNDHYAIIFSHWNIPEADLGAGKYIRPTRLVFPSWVCDHSAVKLAVSGHIHRHQIIRNGQVPHVIVGSPIHTDFGDIGSKKYLEINLNGDLSNLKTHDTGAINFVELNYDLVHVGIKALRFESAQIRDSIVKVSVKCTEGQKESIDWEKFQQELSAHAIFVRPIRPLVIKDRTHQPVKLPIGQKDENLVRAWLAEKKPPDVELINKFAQKIME